MLLFLSGYYPSTALKRYDAIMKEIAKLQDFPMMCEVYSLKKQFRKLPVDDCVIFYQVDEEQKRVKIYRILYGRRDIRELL